MSMSTSHSKLQERFAMTISRVPISITHNYQFQFTVLVIFADTRLKYMYFILPILEKFHPVNQGVID